MRERPDYGDATPEDLARALLRPKHRPPAGEPEEQTDNGGLDVENPAPQTERGGAGTSSSEISESFARQRQTEGFERYPKSGT